MAGLDGAISSLHDRLQRYPAGAYPVQHATAQFHLGSALAEQGRLDAAERALRSAVELFHPRLPVEHAKSLNALGAVLRGAGRLDEAATQFEEALPAFRDAGLAFEEGATSFNLGLVRRDQGKVAAALDALLRADELLPADAAPTYAAAVARELGATLLLLGRHDEAVPALERAATLARRTRDLHGLGAAANTLGLALLALERVTEAAEAFRAAAAANPRALRPEDYAMAKANLAVAMERAGDVHWARLAAQQALGVRGPEAVHQNAEATLARVGREAGTLSAVLSGTDIDEWGPIVRDELERWAEADAATRDAEAAAWLEAVTSSPGQASDLVDAWLGGLLELPPPQLDRLVDAALAAWRAAPAATADTFRSVVSRGMIAFRDPQWRRLDAAFSRAPEWR